MEKRIIKTHFACEEDRQPKLYALGNVESGGAEHTYEIENFVKIDFVTLDKLGVTNEVLLAIVIDRLHGFQTGEFNCEENEIALMCCKAALAVLKQRTRDRVKRGVENKAVR